ncbi:MAG TPA: hypothetical protein VFQ00_09580 [Terriglobales bacterium]|nr:hypothetical protein [Terriglobales bacterium]
MLAEWNVEIGGDAPVLEIPWESADGRIQYFDLKRQPELLLRLPEAGASNELREFLQRLNSPESPWETAKCDLWSSQEIEEEEQIFGSPWKFGSYLDLIFADRKKMRDFSAHERWVQSLARCLRSSPDITAAAELNVRRCFDRREETDVAGFYVTFVLRGYGRDESEARKHWGEALNFALQAIIDSHSSIK